MDFLLRVQDKHNTAIIRLSGSNDFRSDGLFSPLRCISTDEKSDTASGGKESDSTQTADGTSSAKTEHCHEKSQSGGS